MEIRVVEVDELNCKITIMRDGEEPIIEISTKKEATKTIDRIAREMNL